MEILVLLLIVCMVGMFITSAMKAACREAIRIGHALQEEAKRTQAEFDSALQQAMRELQKPQAGGPDNRTGGVPRPSSAWAGVFAGRRPCTRGRLIPLRFRVWLFH
jgi:hypothetical protein